MLCGTASRFWTFAFYRMGVGVGEATLSPSAYSIITDMFRPERLAVAISLYSAGIYIGSGLAQVFGGIVIGFAVSATELTVPFVGPVAPWQYVFFAVGFPGLLFTLALLTVREPVRRNRSKSDPSKVVQPHQSARWWLISGQTAGLFSFTISVSHLPPLCHTARLTGCLPT